MNINDIFPLIRSEDFEAGSEDCEKCEREFDLLFEIDHEKGITIICTHCGIASEEFGNEVMKSIVKAFKMQGSGMTTITELTNDIKYGGN